MLLWICIFGATFLSNHVIFGDVDIDNNNQVTSLGCYVCSSINGSNADCEDEFNAKAAFYVPNCMAARKSYKDGNTHTSAVRTGLYPATWCIKFKATDRETGVTHTIRDCAADSGGTTYDTEIGGMSHCGILMREIKYNGRDMDGCIMTCKANGCNNSHKITYSYLILISSFLLSVTTYMHL